MQYILSLLILLAVNFCSFAQDKIEWNNKLELPAIDGKASIGVAGAYCGVVGDYLVVAGGANFPDGTPWSGAAKKWHSTIYYKDITDDNSEWKIVENGLPSPIAYGVSIELEEGLLCIGGCDATKCYDELVLIGIKNGEIKISNNFPKLPTPLANATGARLKNYIYIAGGSETMKDERATSHFYMLNVMDLESGWQELNTWGGAERGYAASAAQNGSFYLFSGRNYSPENGIEILDDGYVYDTTSGRWSKLNGKFPVMAGSALPLSTNKIMLLGGSDTIIAGSDDHPGFGNTYRIYDIVTNELTTTNIDYPITVTTSVATHGNTLYIGSGEIKPGIRTPIILQGTININK